ncbi:MAG TPA: hemerythrin domain-containing protein [Elusimicrobiota bacterium]|nr:hemerythrin domain-containing protein [Elusimicrobiota bacterium]
MSVFAGLEREHRVFARLARQCERSLARGEADARRELAETMRVLLPALVRHEEVEDLLFRDPAYAARNDAKRILAVVDAQHDEIEALRAELEALLRDARRCDFERLKTGVSLFVRKLAFHFETEENLLWPSYNSLGSRSIRRSLSHEVDERVDEMETEMRREKHP